MTNLQPFLFFFLGVHCCFCFCAHVTVVPLPIFLDPIIVAVAVAREADGGEAREEALLGLGRFPLLVGGDIRG
jgi:hypothetical protein